VEVLPARGAGPELKHSGVPLLLYLGSAVAIALLVACANVAGLMLARSAVRRREFAIRLSLGASRPALVRQLLIESLLIAFPAGVLGYLLAPWGTRALEGLLVGSTEIAIRTNLNLSADGRVLAFTLAVSLGSVLLFGLVPALQATQLNLLRSLRGEAPVGRWQRRLGGTVVVAQVALSVMLLFSAGVLVRGMMTALRVDPGFRAEQAVSVSLSPEGAAYEDASRKAAFFAEVVRRLDADPEIAAAGLASAVLLDFAPELVVGLPGKVLPEPGAERRVHFNAVTPGVIELLGIPLLRGRTLRSQDREGAPLVAVVNETMARRLWPAGEALGERFSIEGQEFEVVGVVADAKYIGAGEQQSPYVFLSYSQNPERVWSTNVYASVRHGDPRAAVATIRRTVQALDPDVPVMGGRTPAENLRNVLQPTRAMGTLIGIGAALALVLAAIGTYALLAHTVTRRTREIGVRMALGARAADVRRLILGQGIGLVLLGTLLGLPLGLVGARVLRAMIPGIGSADPLTLGAIMALLLGVAAAASWFPAWQATRVDPVEALRVE
jgi:predicted permease